MALLLLIVIGASAGWLASVVTRSEASREILRQMGAGLVASLVAGLIANSGTILGALSFLALGAAIAACLVALTLYHAVLRPNAEA